MNRARVSPFGQAVCLAIGLGFCLSVPLQASAQGTPWLPDRQYQEGPGIKVGDLELHPGIAIRGGYDTNVFRADGETREGVTRKKEGAAILAISPHLYLSTKTGQRAKEGEDRGPQQPPFLAFRTGLALHYLHYFLDNAPHTPGAEADFFLGIAQNRVVGLDIGAEYFHNVMPFTQNAQNRKGYFFDTVQPRVRLNGRSRSQVLTGYVGYAPRYTHYYKFTPFDFLNNVQHNAEAGLAWRFLPSTALVYDAGFGYQDYLNLNPTNRALILLSNNKIFRTRLGINGALTNNLLLRVLAGYSAGFFNHREVDDFEDVIGEAVLTYRFDPHAFEIGYQRDIQSSPVGSWYQTDRGFARLNFLFARVFALGLEGGVAYAKYGRLIRLTPAGTVVPLGVNDDNSPDSSRTDIRVDGAVRAEYRVTNYLAFMADFIAQSVITDFDFAVASANGAQIPDPADFTVFQIFGGVRAHY